MKIYRLLTFLSLVVCAIAGENSTTKQLEDVDHPLLEFLHSILTIYVRENYLGDRDVSEYATQLE